LFQSASKSPEDPTVPGEAKVPEPDVDTNISFKSESVTYDVDPVGVLALEDKEKCTYPTSGSVRLGAKEPLTWGLSKIHSAECKSLLY
jgi:hypothetical protein